MAGAESTDRPNPKSHLLPTGIAGLDHVLGGGLPAHHVFLIEGAPGSGKTTLALQFLLQGAACGERTLYVTLAETRNELAQVAASHGWSLDGLEVLELTPPDEVLQPETQYTVFHPSEVETVLARAPGVAQAVVAAVPDASGSSRLVAWVVAAEGAALDLGALERHAREQMPEYMVPSRFVRLAALPKTATGKVDRSALPEPPQERRSGQPPSRTGVCWPACSLGCWSGRSPERLRRR